MPTFDTLEDARAYFEGDRLTDRHRNAEGGVMGGVMMTLIDFAFATAASNAHRPTVAQQVSVNFLSGSRGSALTARAVCRKDGRSSCVYNVDVTDDLGRDIAQAVMTGFKIPKAP